MHLAPLPLNKAMRKATRRMARTGTLDRRETARAARRRDRTALRTTRRLVAPVLAIFLSSFASARADEQVCEREMTRAARENDIPLNVLYAVGLTETGRRGQLSPYDMNVDGRAVRSTNLAEAIEKFQTERANGAKLIDIGCMQINHRWHGADFASLGDMFDPERNVRYAAAFLKQLKAQEGTWTLAVARYNAGPNNNAAQKKYVCAVIGNMVASGLGQWTTNARNFCQ
jgi:soluble lytic murein transglycosylase-like protein